MKHLGKENAEGKKKRKKKEKGKGGEKSMQFSVSRNRK